jgi:hypothetical protein
LVTLPQVQILRTGATAIWRRPAGRGPPCQRCQRSVNVADGPSRVFFPGAATLAEAEPVPLSRRRASICGSGGAERPAPASGHRACAEPNPAARDANARATSAIRGRVLGATGPLSGAEVRITGEAIRQLPAASPTRWAR